MQQVIESVAKASKSLMFKEPFYGIFLISLDKTYSDKIPTACVSKNGINVRLTINPEFWEKSLTVKTKMAVLKHELLHIVFMHLLIHNEFEDKQLFNIAADLEINQFIESEYKDESWVGIELSKYPELNFKPKEGSRFYYKALKQIQENRKKMGLGQVKPQNGKGTSTDPMSKQDLDDMFQRLKDYNTENDGSSPEKSKIWNAYDAMQNGEPMVCSHDAWKEFCDGLSEADRKLIQKQLDYQLKEIASDMKTRNRGTIPNELQSYIDSLFEIEEPVIDWKGYLRRFGGSSSKIYTKKTRRKLNKRYEENPGLKIKQKKNVLLGIDTSGSVSDDDLREFFNEIYHIYKSGVKVTILECDASVGKPYEYKGKMPEFVTGRGGTDFEPVIQYYNDNRKNYNTLIYLTDGYCSAPETKPCTPMLWVVCSDGTDTKNMDNFPGIKVKITR